MIVVSEQESAHLVDEALALEAARTAFRASTTAPMFPITVAHGDDAENVFSVKPGAAAFGAGLKVGSFWPGNEELGLERHSSTILLLDPRTGRVAAVIEAAQANALRTAAADALAVEQLGRPDAHVLTVFGTGHQALYECIAIARVRTLSDVLVVGRRPEATASLARRLEDAGLPARAAEARDGCESADIIVTVTTAREPLFDAGWVRPGTHLSAMGADTPGKQELPVELYERARLFCDLPEQSRREGEFQHAPLHAPLTTLGAVLTGVAAGRTAPDQVTVFDSSGFGLQDLALAVAILDKLGIRL